MVSDSGKNFSQGGNYLQWSNSEKPDKELLEWFEQLREILSNFNQNLHNIQDKLVAKVIARETRITQLTCQLALRSPLELQWRLKSHISTIG